MDTIFLDEFSTAPTEQWITMHSGKVAGTVRTAGGAGSGAGNVTFVTVHEAGSVKSPFLCTSIIYQSFLGTWSLSINLKLLW
jgi:hypothetical protein